MNPGGSKSCVQMKQTATEEHDQRKLHRACRMEQFSPFLLLSGPCLLLCDRNLGCTLAGKSEAMLLLRN